jgi:hypothetical protein
MIKSASLPASTIGTVQAPYFGRKINLTGDRTFDPWTVTVINDEDFVVRNSMEQWMSYLNSHEGNKEQFANARPANYKTQATITQFGKDGTKLRIYKFQGLFPSQVSDIPMGWESADQLEEFTVTFTYDWWTVSGGTTGDGSTQV